jgi:hypothetical protein
MNRNLHKSVRIRLPWFPVPLSGKSAWQIYFNRISGKPRMITMTDRYSRTLITLIALAILVLPASADINVIAQGGDVFIGEEGLNVNATLGGFPNIAWFRPGATPSIDTPDYSIAVGNPLSFYVAPADFVGRTGNWYRWNGVNQGIAFNVVDPNIDIKVWDQNANKDCTGKQVSEGNFLNFRIETNTYSVVNRPGFNATADGFVKIRVKNPGGAVYTSLYQGPTTAIPLTHQVVDSSLWYWVTPAGDMTKGWNTAVTDAAGSRLYNAGTYMVSAELDPFNKIKDNYKAPDGADYTGKTVTPLKTIAITADTLTIEASHGIVSHGNQFSVTVTGRANEFYYIWVNGTSSMSGGSQDQPPLMAPNQEGVANDPVHGPYTIGAYQYGGGGGKTITQDVPIAPNNGVFYYAQMKTSSGGTRTVGFLTGADTDDKTYTIRVENIFGGQYTSEEVDVKVEKGTVTIVAAGDHGYFFGEEVKLSGTNSGTDTVFLFITGPNLPPNGGLLTDPSTPVDQFVVPPVFTIADVNDDNTWEYHWQTANLNISAGIYTLYAVATPNDKNNLSDALYGNVTVVLNTPGFTGLNVMLNGGWNIFSTPILLEQGSSPFSQVFSEAEQGKMQVILGWNGTTWYIPKASDEMRPLDAFYIKVKEGEIALATIVPSNAVSSLPARSIDSGVHLIGSAPAYDAGTQNFPEMPLTQAFTSIEYVGGLPGYTIIVSPPLNQAGWTYAKGGQIFNVQPFKGYWVVMENGPDTLYGFSTTPMSN